ncbi:hypothetical protein Ahy_A02g005490 isoform H [Arachis hypogaea]|uniref:Uncharacterized protein n=1 Tax=Arachis hypogaea TaxID=3818 RepID=A0A445E6V0_ARAHY|nr:hypothetical protein Ahy_A02g005490 isoform H [Arachis hypogaea]
MDGEREGYSGNRSSGDGMGPVAQRIRARGYEPRCWASNPSSPTTGQKARLVRNSRTSKPLGRIDDYIKDSLAIANTSTSENSEFEEERK